MDERRLSYRLQYTCFTSHHHHHQFICHKSKQVAVDRSKYDSNDWWLAARQLDTYTFTQAYIFLMLQMMMPVVIREEKTLLKHQSKCCRVIIAHVKSTSVWIAYPSYLQLATSEMWCWSGERGILTKLSLCYSIVYHYNGAYSRSYTKCSEKTPTLVFLHNS